MFFIQQFLSDHNIFANKKDKMQYSKYSQ